MVQHGENRGQWTCCSPVTTLCQYQCCMAVVCALLTAILLSCILGNYARYETLCVHLYLYYLCVVVVIAETTTVLWPFFRDHPGEPVPEENFWILWCKGRLTEADTLTIRLGATPSGLTSAHLHHPPHFSDNLYK